MLHVYQMDFFKDEGQIHFSYSTSEKLVWILNMCKIKKTYSLPLADWIRIVFLKLRHTKHWVIVWASIYNWNCYKASFSKRGRRGMINVWEDEVELSSLIHCIYIFMKKLIYSLSFMTLSISIVIVFNQVGLWLRYSM